MKEQRGFCLTLPGGSDLTLFEIQEAAAIIHESADAEANIIFGANIDENLGEEVRVTVIATGFDSPRVAVAEPSQRSRAARAPHTFLDRNDLEIPPFILKNR